MIVVLLEMLSGACLLVCLFSLCKHNFHARSVYDNDVFLTKITLNGFQGVGGKRGEHKGVLSAFSFFSKVLTSYYKCQGKGGIYFYIFKFFHCHYYCIPCVRVAAASLRHTGPVQRDDVSARARRWHSLLCRSFGCSFVCSRGWPRSNDLKSLELCRHAF